MSITRFFNSQQKFIKKTFGEKAALYANYGWVTGNGAYLTKVYGEKGKFSTTIVETFRNEDNKIVHSIGGALV
jgi:hypothetical protein